MLKNFNKKTLYLSYDGVLEPLGSSQVLNYVLGMSKISDFILYTFEKISDLKDKKRVDEIEQQAKSCGVIWKKSIYHHKPTTVATIYDLIILSWNVLCMLIFQKIKTIHLRGYLLGIPLLLFRNWFNFNLIFDMRGFWADEKADRAGWNKSGQKYKFFKGLEKKLLNKADKIITLTTNSKRILVETHGVASSKIEVIRTCADEKLFIKQPKPYQKEIKFGYLGTLDTAYDFTKVLRFFKKFHSINQDCSLDVYSAKNKDYVDSVARENGFEQIDKISVNFVRDKEKLVNAINSFDVCIFYLNENYSVKASMPTKVGEVLMCGVPIICNKFNEDIEEIINLGCGMVCNFDNDDMQKINQFLLQNKKSKEIQENCRLVASQEFSLNTGLKLYTSIYKDLTYE